MRTQCEAKSANCSNLHDRELAAGWSVTYIDVHTLNANVSVAKLDHEFSLCADSFDFRRSEASWV